MSIYTKKINLPFILEKILNHLQEIGAKPILVGGCVRDHFLNIPIKDYDIEVFNIKTYEILAQNLKMFGKVHLVGKSFGVIKLQVSSYEFDFSIPRLETKIDLGHKGFEIELNPNLSFKEAAKRRDFTINALGYDYCKKDFIDCYDGFYDLKNKELKHINDKTFVEDPLRVYRAIQFASRFEFTLNEKTKILCKKLVDEKALDELAKERVFEELKKLFLKSSKPSIGFTLIKELGIINHFFHNHNKLFLKENFISYWNKLLSSLDKMSKLKTNDEKRDIILFLAIICFKVNNKKDVLFFLEKVTDEKKLIDEVISICLNNSIDFISFYKNPNLAFLKRLSLNVNIENLCLVYLAISNSEKEIYFLLEESKKLDINNKKFQALIQGKDLVDLGFKAGKEFKNILDFAFNLQIDSNLKKEELKEELKRKFF
ncbi:MAG: CCA tRNA nucleotidyltransferase [Campylobacteraceae bacterium]|nr:CCA tRNA nucleotidyltransferase [Campylobacteraceae bacterium]